MTQERKHSIDKLFQSSLAGDKIEPSAAVWESLSAHVPTNRGKGTLLFLFTAIAIGALTFLLHSTIVDPTQETSEPVLAQNELISRGQQAEADPVIPSAEEGAEVAVEIQEDITSTIEEEPIDETNDLAENINPPSVLKTEEAVKQQANESPMILLANTAAYTPESGDKMLSYAYENLQRIIPLQAHIDDGSKREINTREDADPGEPIFDLNLKDTYVRKAEVLFGASFSPAVNIYPDRQNHNDYSFDIVAAYEKSRFIVETGIGANFSSESAQYQINYTTYDSVGYYIGVTSFTNDPNNPDSIIFNTNLKSIYDSIDRYSIQENTNRYVYLQIPIRIGYRVLETKRFSLDLKAGLLFSLQIHKDIPGAPYQGNDVEVIRQYPDRLSSYWQYTASASFNYQINRQIRFSIEPFYRQYIKSAYSPYSVYPAKSPYGFGLRGGLYFHF